MDYLLNIVVKSFSTPVFLFFFIAFAGYAIGRVTVKGVSLGTAGVFLAALLFGHFGYADDSLLHSIGLVNVSASHMKIALSLVQSIGLICFVTSVGFIAGPKFFHDLRANATSYVLEAVVIIGSGALVCVVVTALTDLSSAVTTGLLAGALTSTPGFAAAQEAVAGNEALLHEVSVAYGIAYPFGVIGVVLFVQLMPMILGVDIEEERSKISIAVSDAPQSDESGSDISIDPFGFCAFSLAVILGILIGRFRVPLPGGASFSLGNTGGALLLGLLFGHFGHIGPFSLKVRNASLETFREFGLMLFLIGAGVPGGSGFVAILKQHGTMLFIYGALMTLVPLLCGYFFSRYRLKMCLFNNLGSITGGMTSTPALGTLINVAQSSDVVSAYAVTYPCALVLVVLACQFIVTLL
ncbi:MAG: permease [Pyramidobacter porci]|uniref:aspartate-alanine antiporter-like transporter n=1 Tax=Pyramidobacter porci TaxID=2605789 RepID=UPI002A761353|nr:permease [Pyramidobacter porci]MCI6261094.1 permease [Pyramidobacter sp.]MDY2649333.1 permease [Pyramidobacter porci]